MTAARLIDEADGLSSIGLHEDAWEVLETIPPLLKLGPDVLRVRLMICAGLELWEMGQHALEIRAGKITAAAKDLGVSRPTFYELMDKLGIAKEP